MDPEQFNAPLFGSAAREPGNRWAFWHFLPAIVPRDLPLDTATVAGISDAEASLGRLHGLGTLLVDPELLIGPILTREAVASSRIEGTVATLTDVLRAEAGGRIRSSDDLEEVERYLAATREGYELISELPISQRLILRLHKTLMQSVRGQDRSPGELRRTPVWVGAAGDNPDTATYVPPLPGDLPDLIADWERFANERGGLPVLVRCALMHYQFETIHPFLDGNGRIGRLLINLMLLEAGRLNRPLLYVSGYLEQHRREYYDRLQAVRERGEIQQWLQFFCLAVRRSSDDAVARAERVVRLRERFLAEVGTSRSIALRALVDLIFANPFLTTARLVDESGVSPQSARVTIRQAATVGWVVPYGRIGQGVEGTWVAQEILDVLDAPWTYERERD